MCSESGGRLQQFQADRQDSSTFDIGDPRSFTIGKVSSTKGQSFTLAQQQLMYFSVLGLGRILDQSNVDDVENSAGSANSFQVIPVTRILHLTCQSAPDSCDLTCIHLSTAYQLRLGCNDCNARQRGL